METAMTATYAAKKISPMLAVADMEETLSFYHDILGFTPVMKSPEYSIVQRDGQTIHFMKAASEEVMRCVRGHTEIYIEVSDIGLSVGAREGVQRPVQNPQFVRPRLRHDRIPHRRPQRLPRLRRRANPRAKVSRRDTS